MAVNALELTSMYQAHLICHFHVTYRSLTCLLAKVLLQQLTSCRHNLIIPHLTFTLGLLYQYQGTDATVPIHVHLISKRELTLHEVNLWDFSSTICMLPVPGAKGHFHSNRLLTLPLQSHCHMTWYIRQENNNGSHPHTGVVYTKVIAHYLSKSNLIKPHK